MTDCGAGLWPAPLNFSDSSRIDFFKALAYPARMTLPLQKKPLSLAPSQKREVALMVRKLNAALALGRRGTARRISLPAFLKEARRQFPELSRNS